MIHPRLWLSVDTITLPLCDPGRWVCVGSDPRVVVLVGSGADRLGG